MRIVLFTDTFLPQINGVTNTLSKLVEYFEANNIEYLIFAPESDVKQEGKYNVETFFSLRFFMYPECKLAIPNFFRLNQVISEFKPDLIHLMTEFNMGITGMKCAKKFGIPTISNYSTNICDYLKYYNLDILNKHAWKYMKWFHNENNLTICPSNEIKELLKNQGVTNVDIFSRGIDSKKFSPDFRSIELRKKLGIDDKIVFLYVGRVAPEKDLDILLQSYRNIKAKYGEKVALIITGDGPSLEQLKKEFPEDTIFTGFKRGIELSEIYASSDIFVFPSSTETFGNVILEAMASGLPVIGADAGGIKDTINHGVNGLLFRERDSEKLTHSIEALIEREALKSTLKYNGRITAMNRSWEAVFDKLMHTYSEVIQNKKIKCNITA